MAFSEDTSFKTGDSLFSLTRKILSRLNQGITTSGGGGGGGGGGAVTIADGAAVTIGSLADAQSGPLPGSFSIVSLLKTIAFEVTQGSVPVTAANTFPVSGNVGGKTFQQVNNITVSTSAYVAGYNVGGIITLSNAMTVSNGTGILESLLITDTSNQKAPFDIFIFSSNPTAATATDHAAFTFSTDILKVIARIPVFGGDYVTVGSVPYAIAYKQSLGQVVKAAGGGQNLYAAIVTSGTPTYASTSALQFVWGILQD